MNITQDFKRRIHIEGKPGETEGYMLTITDADTGEMITNVREATIHTSVEHENWADVTFYEMDEEGHIKTKDSEPIEGTVRTNDPEISLTAYMFKP